MFWVKCPARWRQVMDLEGWRWAMRFILRTRRPAVPRNTKVKGSGRPLCRGHGWVVLAGGVAETMAAGGGMAARAWAGPGEPPGAHSLKAPRAANPRQKTAMAAVSDQPTLACLRVRPSIVFPCDRRRYWECPRPRRLEVNFLRGMSNSNRRWANGVA